VTIYALKTHHPDRTMTLPFLRFRLGRIPVSIAPWFFFTAAFLNFDLAPQKLALWVLLVLASILVHELGHATAVLVFGLEPRIDVHGLGGTTSWSGGAKLSHGKRIIISLAGPAMGFLAWAAVLALRQLGVLPHTPLGDFTYSALSFVNLGWGVFNLLPMLPLDGGSVLLHALDAATKGRGERPARIVSLSGALLLAVGGAVLTDWWICFLALLFANTNWQGLKASRARDHDAPMQASLEQAYEALEAKDAARVLALARPVALESQTVLVRAEALQLVAFGFLLEGRLADADAAIAALPQGFAPHPSLLELRATVAGPSSS
jgi:Zn-dependent protease